MRVAEVKNGEVVEIHEINRPIADFPGAGYVEITTTVFKKWLYDGTNFTPHATHAAEEAEKSRLSINATALGAIVALSPSAIEAMLTVVERLGLPAEKAIVTPIKNAIAIERAKIIP